MKFSASIGIILLMIPFFVFGKDARDIAPLLKESLVGISIFYQSEQLSSGSGFAISEDGLIVTNYHVIEGGDSIFVKTSNGETFERVAVIDSDERRDIAILRLPTRNLSPLQFAPLGSFNVGDDVFAIGNPLGLEATFSSGIISAQRVIDGVEVLQITAPISAGSSGGPVVNENAQVIGISMGLIEDGQNINFAVPIKYVQGLLDMGGRPVSYADFAAENWKPGRSTLAVSEQISPWVIEQAKNIDYDLERLKEILIEVDEPTQEVLFQMAVQVEEAAKLGYEWIDERHAGVATEEGVFGSAFELDKGNYLAVGVCDKDCGDIALAVIAENGELIASHDTENDAFPVAEFTVHVPQSLVIGTSIRSCEIEPCMQMIGVLRQVKKE